MERSTRVVKVGSLMIGGQWPVSVQTMWKSPLPSDPNPGPGNEAFDSVLKRIHSLASLGCDVLRFAVPDDSQARYLGALAEVSPIPLVADIHFDWRLALLCLDYPIAKIRINPGNIGSRWKTAEVVAKAKERSIPLRIGVNAGSLPEDFRAMKDPVQACLAATEREIAAFESLGFDNFLVSMKLNDPRHVEEANRAFSKKHSYPLHLGVTEAGPLISGVARNTAALVPLLRGNRRSWREGKFFPAQGYGEREFGLFPALAAAGLDSILMDLSTAGWRSSTPSERISMWQSWDALSMDLGKRCTPT
ncbi:MAG: (E)-4-hydroxy-3-methylbut-2-enyl-diphosphate synthase [Spirochaetes bacterium]|nr:MAG: (E)-4-hydroxy-3-methylbut-2-enyl-diphosphate synthase [Spirochaetota bacterium]